MQRQRSTKEKDKLLCGRSNWTKRPRPSSLPQLRQLGLADLCLLRLGINCPGAVVIPFVKRPTQGEVLELLSKGKTQKEVAAILGIGERTIQRIVASQKTTQEPAKMEPPKPQSGGSALVRLAGLDGGSKYARIVLQSSRKTAKEEGTVSPPPSILGHF
jgi:DNA-binding CsgD family transcriptional regulator